MKSFLLGGAALLSVVAFSAPALAHRHHHAHHTSDAAERQRTDELNAQQLALARGQQPMQQQAAATMPEQSNAMTAPQTPAPESTAPPDQTQPNVQPPTETPPSPQQ
jgi:hypothetical protein